MPIPTRTESRATKSKASRACAGCAGKSKRVEPVTIRSLVRSDVHSRLSTEDGFRFCGASACDVVYSHAVTGDTVGVDDVKVEVFEKSSNEDRLVCYCFGHSVRDVRADVSDRAILADIEDKCRQGLDRCARENPQGRCCLGNVRKVYASS